ncbi:hypothetical protein GNP80_05480 [Aliivibrio fischeri]|uniref:hypothetical protein n=1 Tax=Aliivibrio fischeri TaxID=668 RepID=UPI0012D96DC9|nr:hypothetical protein [Aliivibrio fischeri]MUK91886.1 hypothetical protein [Aliivibrio fischeri]
MIFVQCLQGVIIVTFMLCKYYCLGHEEVGYEKLFANLKRINTVLDGKQQREFNGWVYRLAKAKKQSEISSMPFTPKREIG